MSEKYHFDSVGFKCKCCGYAWLSKKPIKPAECPNCRSSYWNMHNVRKGYSIDEDAFSTAKYILQNSPKSFFNHLNG